MKLAVTSAALRLRRFRPELFTGYAPLPAVRAGRRRTPSRSPAGARPVASASSPSPPGSRSACEAPGGWRDTVLPLPGAADDWTDVVTGRPVDGSAPALGALLDRFPVALLVRPA